MPASAVTPRFFIPAGGAESKADSQGVEFSDGVLLQRCAAGRLGPFLCGWVSCFPNPGDSGKARGALRCGAEASGGQGLRGPAPRKGQSPLNPFFVPRQEFFPFRRIPIGIKSTEVYFHG